MQEGYLGDSHDFLKYALLRRLHARTGMRLGVNWYRTEPEAVDHLGSRLVQSQNATAAARLTAERKFLASLS